MCLRINATEQEYIKQEGQQNKKTFMFYYWKETICQFLLDY
jgi:hypothetical protein